MKQFQDGWKENDNMYPRLLVILIVLVSLSLLPSHALAINNKRVFEAQSVPTVTTIIDNPDPSRTGEFVSILIAVTSKDGIPTGNLTFSVNGGPDTVTVDLVDGHASLWVYFSESGEYTLTAEFEGEFYLPSSDTELHTVNPGGINRIFLPLVWTD
jgi:Bacterial Ig-like domain (group 3)